MAAASLRLGAHPGHPSCHQGQPDQKVLPGRRAQGGRARKIARNKDCLVRLYLGSRRPNWRCEGEFSVRNFELTLDKMDALGLDARQYVVPMAQTLAILHCDCLVDAYDVEFVLGSPPDRPMTFEQFKGLDSSVGLTSSWLPHLETVEKGPPGIWRRTVRVLGLLDFNQTARISLDHEGCRQAVRSFFENDPYYPRPVLEGATTEAALWALFKEPTLPRLRTRLLRQGSFPWSNRKRQPERAWDRHQRELWMSQLARDGDMMGKRNTGST